MGNPDIKTQIYRKKKEIEAYLKVKDIWLEASGRYNDKTAERLSFELLALLNKR